MKKFQKPLKTAIFWCERPSYQGSKHRYRAKFQFKNC
nr:MAG TPA: hypothetical protein [Bacteriophage sp.]